MSSSCVDGLSSRRPSTRHTVTAAVILTCVFGCSSSAEPLFVETSAGELPRLGKTYGGTLLDADGDGDLDLLLSRHSDTAEIHLNRGNLHFERYRDEDGALPRLDDHHGSAACDYDHDGDWDLYLTVGAGGGLRPGPNQLWTCRDPFSFDSQLPEPFLADPDGRGRGALWLSLDEDPGPELLVLNFESPSRLFSYRGGEFEDRTSLLPPFLAREGRKLPPPTKSGRAAPPHRKAPRYWFTAACAGDMNGDGWPELFVAGRMSMLLTSTQKGELRDVTDSSGIEFARFSISQPCLGDVDGDADLDLVLAYAGPSRIEVWLNESEGGDPRFVRGPAASHLPVEHEVVSMVLADLDNDGRLDLYAAQLNAEGDNTANLVARGMGGGRFELPRPPWGAAAAVPSRSTGAWAVDLDADGDLELLTLQGGGRDIEAEGAVALYENRTRYLGLTLELAGEGEPPHGLGARIRLRGESVDATRFVLCVANPWNSTILPVHFGVGSARGPFVAEIQWPSGAKEDVTVPEAGRAYRIRKGAPTAEPAARR